jgi:hypothetical protein
LGSMPITARCPTCSRTISAPDYAAGHKARCPHCRTVVEIPGELSAAAVPPQEIEVHEAAMSPAEALAMEARRMRAEAVAAATPPSGAAGTPSPERSSALRTGSRSGLRASAIERLIAKTSPYTPLRTLASVILGVGVTLAVLLAFAGLAVMLFLAVGGGLGGLEVGIAIFIGSVFLAVLLGMAAKVTHAMLRLGADLGDRVRQTAMLLEDLLNRPRDETF